MSTLLDLVFPPHCIACGVFGEWCCAVCFEKIEFPVQKMIEGLDGCTVLGMYHDPIWRAVIHGLKYRGGTCLLPVIRGLASERLPCLDLPWKDLLEISIQHLPTDEMRERERGFDQAKVLVSELAEILHPKPLILNQVSRLQSQTAQAHLNDPGLRRANVAGIYGLLPGTVPEVVLLVDDVVTTGASMTAVADLFRTAGAKRVYGFALALGA